VLPVINENDTTTTDEISFGDNDFLAAQVAVLIGADLLVLLTDVEGRLRRMGVIRALEAAGFEPGDDVEIAGIVFELT
jgi:carbamate kinase